MAVSNASQIVGYEIQISVCQAGVSVRKWVDSEELEAPLKFHAKTTHRTMRVAGHWRGCRFRVAPTAFAKGGSIGGAAALVSHIHRAFAMGE